MKLLALGLTFGYEKNYMLLISFRFVFLKYMW